MVWSKLHVQTVCVSELIIQSEKDAMLQLSCDGCCRHPESAPSLWYSESVGRGAVLGLHQPPAPP